MNIGGIDFAAYAHHARQATVHFFKNDAPDLLVKTAQSLHKADFDAPFTMSHMLELAPVLGGIVLFCSIPFSLGVGSPQTYTFTRKLIIKMQALLYAMGFSVSALQHRALWGSEGLSPHQPTFRRPCPVFEYFGFGDAELELVSWSGVCIAVCVLRYDFAATSLPMLLMWLLYLSIVNLEAPFTYSYGWEWGTLELGFLAIFFVPVLPTFNFPASHVMIWLYRWAAFRLLLGAGMSKVGRNSSACWRELTCTTTHYYTQPVPNPLSWYFHFLPTWVHQAEVAMTFVEQLCLPWLMLMPIRACRILAGIFEIFLQLCIVGTGNYAWINFYGMLPCLALFDDSFFSSLGIRLEKDVVSTRLWTKLYQWLHGLAIAVLACVIVVKSTDPVREMFSPAPWINNYDPYFIMNSQGVFGFINQHRIQPVLEFTHAENSTSRRWAPLDFKCLPGSVDRIPCLMSPYHYRLDWETWIRTTASMERYITHPQAGEIMQDNLPQFLRTLIQRLLHGDDDTLGLMGRPDLYAQRPPSAIRLRFYSYTFESGSTSTWARTPLGKSRIFKKERLPTGHTIRRSPRQRHWILGAALYGLTSSLWPQTVAVFALAFLADYTETHMVKLALLPSTLYWFAYAISGGTLLVLFTPLGRKGTLKAAYLKNRWHTIAAYTLMAFFSYGAFKSYEE